MKTKKCAFTIVAKNYIGLAYILESSIKRYNTEIDFFIGVADEIDNSVILPHNVLIARRTLKYPDSTWNDMAFKYTLTEFCTSIKPRFIEYFFERGYERVIYLDPDTFFFSDIKIIYDDLEKYDIVLSPHILSVPSVEVPDIEEPGFLNYGIYNLGFIAVKNTDKTLQIMKWWSNRLEKYAFIDLAKGLFTDQIWMNFIPSFMSNQECLISRNKGYDVAPWNYFEREIIKNGDHYNVKFRNVSEDTEPNLLVFAHFSGYDYSLLAKGEVLQKTQPNLRKYEDISMLLDDYIIAIKNRESVFKEFIRLTYTYSTFNNGTVITNLMRRIYSIWSKNNISRQPFDASHTYYKLLKKNHLIPKIEEGDQPIDKLTKVNFNNYTRYKSLLIRCQKILLRFIGVKRYTLLLRYFQIASRFDAQAELLE